MAFDVESKYLYNGFPYLGKEWTRSVDTSLPTDVMMKLMIPLFSQGFNVTCDNYFTSLDLSLRLTKRQCSFGGDNSSKPKENSRLVEEEAYVA